jgi:YD repeat-containing protein
MLTNKGRDAARITIRRRTPYRLLATLLVALMGGVALTACKSSYTYDAIDRMTSVTHNDGSVDKYTYDATGNIIRIQHIAAPKSNG